MFELERIVAFSLERSHQLLWHPLDLGFCKFNDIETDIVAQGQRVGHQTRFFILPQLVKHVGKFQNTTSSVNADLPKSWKLSNVKSLDKERKKD